MVHANCIATASIQLIYVFQIQKPSIDLDHTNPLQSETHWLCTLMLATNQTDQEPPLHSKRAPAPSKKLTNASNTATSKISNTLKLLPSNKLRMPSVHLSNTSNVYHYLLQQQKLLTFYHLASKDLKMYLRLIWATTLPVVNMMMTARWLWKGQRVCWFTNTYLCMSFNLTLCREEVLKCS